MYADHETLRSTLENPQMRRVAGEVGAAKTYRKGKM